MCTPGVVSLRGGRRPDGDRKPTTMSTNTSPAALGDWRAVSPLVGVALMLAMSLALAAVIGTALV
jgi:hypothetical protein